MVLYGHWVGFYLDDGKHIDRDFFLVERGVFRSTRNDPRSSARSSRSTVARPDRRAG
jgi:hypothetical protein